MQLFIQRQTLLEPLQMLISVVERKQTLPILGNVLISAEDKAFSMTATDLEVELISRATLDTSISQPAAFTVPAHKLLDICKSLPEQSELQLTIEETRVVLASGRSRFVLSTLPAKNFPTAEIGAEQVTTYTIKQTKLSSLLQRTHFAMAQQDIRHHLNGMLLEIQTDQLSAIALDGHRFAMNTTTLDKHEEAATQVTLPRKGALELIKLLKIEPDNTIEVSIGENHIRFIANNFTFTSKLISGRFPNYQQLLPQTDGKTISLDRDMLKEALLRVSILSNEKLRIIKLKLTSNLLHIFASNTNQEEAEETIATEYAGEEFEVGFNVTYLLDILNTTSAGLIDISFLAPKNRIMIKEQANQESMFLVMPLQL